MYEARQKGKISAYTVLLGRLPRLPSSYMPFAYRYPTNLLQCPDRTAFAPVALMLSCLGTATYSSCSAKPAQHEHECYEGFAMQLICWKLLSCMNPNEHLMAI